MTDPVPQPSAASACEAAIYGALSTGVTLATVYQHVPEDTPPPVVIIGELSSSDAATKTDADEEFSIEIATLVIDEQRKPVLDIQGEVKAALHLARLSSGGFSFRPIQTGSLAHQMADGETYYGTQTFRVLLAD